MNENFSFIVVTVLPFIPGNFPKIVLLEGRPTVRSLLGNPNFQFIYACRSMHVRIYLVKTMINLQEK